MRYAKAYQNAYTGGCDDEEYVNSQTVAGQVNVCYPDDEDEMMWSMIVCDGDNAIVVDSFSDSECSHFSKSITITTECGWDDEESLYLDRMVFCPQDSGTPNLRFRNLKAFRDDKLGWYTFFTSMKNCPLRNFFTTLDEVIHRERLPYQQIHQVNKRAHFVFPYGTSWSS